MTIGFYTWNSLAAVLLALCGLCTPCAAAQETGLVLRGTWTATAGSQTFRGSWGAGISRSNPNSAEGYWTLVNESDERVMDGTWTARKTGTRWRGTWTARITRGRAFSGVWDADISDTKAKTFTDMLRRTIEKEIAGSWQSGRYGGNWWLRGARTNEGTR